MYFNVSSLCKEGVGARRSYELAAELPREDGAAEPVSGEVELLRTLDGVLVTAHLTLIAVLECARCLTVQPLPFAIEFEEEFLAPLGHEPDPDAPERDPEAFLIDERYMLDLTEAVRQYREVSIAMQPLCRPDCRGLCPNCGRDLNSGDCDCDKAIVDTRWAGLLALRTPGEGKE